MTGIAGSEVLLLLLIGLVILGPQRLPKIASQLGSWVGQARRMTRAMKRQLEDELRTEEFKDFKLNPFEPHVPNDEDTYSPLHSKKPATPATPPSAIQSNATASEVATPDQDEEGEEEEHDTMRPPTARVRDAGEPPDDTA